MTAPIECSPDSKTCSIPPISEGSYSFRDRALCTSQGTVSAPLGILPGLYGWDRQAPANLRVLVRVSEAEPVPSRRTSAERLGLLP